MIQGSKEQYQVKISNTFTALEYLSDDVGGGDVDINRAWERI
jgi:hypothetical protein